ncbi:amino acid adenylation domain-containing protein [Klebsiella aerogenes]|nr:amino acid adenylation domain-containing protein [Klebsiella aerogenes]
MNLGALQPKLIHLALAEYATRTPNKIAVIHGNRSLTYQELHQLSNQLAHYLVSRGVKSGDSVGICFQPCLNTLMCILAILKTGAAYIPLDPMNPPERLKVISNQVDNLQFIFTTVETRDNFSIDKQVILTDTFLKDLNNHPATAPEITVESDHLCYIVFTSGTTGIPKAVAVRHRGWANLLNWFQNRYQLNELSVNLLVSSFGFDISQRSMLTPIYTGSTLVISESKYFDPILIGELINKHNVQTLHLAPSSLYAIIESWPEINRLPSLRYLFIGGEALSVPRITGWAMATERQCEFIHQYGVAECTDVATSYTMRHFSRYLEEGIPLGETVAGCNIHVVDENFIPVENGHSGELIITGTGVGAGYINNEELNKQRFIQLPVNNTWISAYRSGDFARKRDDGEFVCIGRKDNQIKIRGILTNLSDIENVVKANNSIVKEAIVIPYNESETDTRLCIFLYSDITEHLRPELTVIKSEIINHLPMHMIPTKYQWIESFPLTTNGKVNRNALAELII